MKGWTSCTRTTMAVVLLAFMLFVSGCDPVVGDMENGILEAEASSVVEMMDVSVEAGRLVFDDLEEFGTFMNSIVNKQDSVLNDFEVREEFVSLRTDTERLKAQVDDDIVDALEIVEDPYFATALNQQGEVKIGEHVYRVTRNHVYRAVEANAQDLEWISLRNTDLTANLEKFAGSRGIESYKVIRYESGLSAIAKHELEEHDICYAYGGYGTQLLGKSWIYYSRIYASVGSKTEARNVGSGGGALVALTLHVNYDITITWADGFLHSPYVGTQSLYSATGSLVSYVIPQSIETEYTGITGYIHSQHSGTAINLNPNGSVNSNVIGCNTSLDTD